MTTKDERHRAASPRQAPREIFNGKSATRAEGKSVTARENFRTSEGRLPARAERKPRRARPAGKHPPEHDEPRLSAGSLKWPRRIPTATGSAGPVPPTKIAKSRRNHSHAERSQPIPRAKNIREFPAAAGSTIRITAIGPKEKPGIEPNLEDIMQGPKTHEQQKRILERKPDLGDKHPANSARSVRDPAARQSEFPVSQHGMNQESDHNKHNDPGQSGHKPQQHRPAEQKQD
jgi:hypothetical protein